MNIKTVISLSVFCCLSLLVQGQSFFATGQWTKIGVKNQGVYQVDKEYLESIGVDVSEPKNIAFFGGDGSMLPQANSETITQEPLEVPVLLLDTGAYKDNFSILFYNEGAKKVSLDDDNLLSTEINIYSDSVYYYVGVLDHQSQKIEQQSSSKNTIDGEVTVYNHRELEEENILTSGREWLSDKMDDKTPSQSIEASFYNPIADVSLLYDFVGISYENSIDFNLQLEDSLILTRSVARSTDSYGVKARSISGSLFLGQSLFTDQTQFTVSLDNQGDINAHGYINYLSWQYSSDGSIMPNGVPFYSLGTSKKITLTKDINKDVLWSFNLNNREQKVILGTSNENQTSYSLASDTVELIFVDITSVPYPDFIQKVENQDIMSFDSKVELLIVYHQSLESEVLRLEDHKIEMGLNTQIAEVGDVFDQFSNGKKDISAIRNYAKYVYENSSDFKYLMLFGDCSYDYKDHSSDNTNLIPVYESEQSYHNVQTYASDDYYGFLENGEGTWEERSTGNHTLDIAIGRLPVRNVEEAAIVVDKIINYEAVNEEGDWKKNIVFVADDGDDTLHVTQANVLSSQVSDLAPFMKQNKEYLDTYERTLENVSLAKEKLLSALDDGALFVNYTGHGSEFKWMSEQLLTIHDINNITNNDRLPVFITATCEFGRLDDPLIFSGAESLFINDQGGAIALVTTTRPVYSSSNFTINKAFYTQVFSKNEEGNYRTLGEIFRDTKNNSLNGVFNRNFSLVGDPSLKLKLPNYKVSLEKINGISAQEFSDSILPVQTTVLEGNIVNQLGINDSMFNGYVEIVVYDNQEVKTTLGYSDQLTAQYVNDALEIYKGRVKVIDGEFKAEVVLPVEIASSFGSSQIVFYAHDSTGLEAFGVQNDLSIGGEAILEANDLPEIDLLVLNKDKIADDIYADLELYFTDDYGILMSEGVIGKETTLTLNGDFQNKVKLNDQMELVNGSAKNVRVGMKLENLAVGQNEIELQTWDVHGESVINSFTISLDVYNELTIYPNPVIDELNLMVKKTSIDDEYLLQLKIYDNTGKLLFDDLIDSDQSKFIDDIKIDLDNLNINSAGIYFYDMNLNYLSTDDVYVKKGKIIKL